MLLRAARFEIERRRGSLPHLRGGDFDDLAHQAADDALVAILGKLDTYRGESRFTTWAYKFALLEAAVKLRRRAWQGREVRWSPSSGRASPKPESPWPARRRSASCLGEVGKAIETELSPHQREVLVAIVLNEVPINSLAQRLETTRGALYKTVHDARQKLRAHLADAGLRFTATERKETMSRQTDPHDRDLVERILGPEGPELSCEECFTELDRYVELGLSEDDAESAVPGMRAHLEGCGACEEDHRSLRALIETETGG